MTDHPALKLVADLLKTLGPNATSSIVTNNGHESEQFNLFVLQHPISGEITVSVRPGSPLESPVHFNAIQTVAKRHGATWNLPTPPIPRRPKKKRASPTH